MDERANPPTSKRKNHTGLLVAVIVIAAIIVIVLPILLLLGVFNYAPKLGTLCIAQSGYSCLYPSLSGGVLSLSFGQATGATFQNVTLYALTTPSTFNINAYNSYPKSQSIQSLLSGQLLNRIPISGGSSQYQLPSSGTFTGTLWMTYSQNQSLHYTQVGTITVSAK